ncbi:MAG: hypothetical protein D6798_11385 [Deltaproteobacteria bacterium]|nr:MAG: hypothetical protein D6798_11385 [Deltaproteobacteria bacterium]
MAETWQHLPATVFGYDMIRRHLLASASLALFCLPGTAAAGDVPSVDRAPDSGLSATRDAAVVIGVEGYDQLPQATFATADAQAWKSWLTESIGVRSSRLTLLEDPDATAVYRALRRAGSRVRRHGTLWLVFSGHGAMTAATGGQRTLLTREAAADALGTDGITLEAAVKRLLRRRRADRLVIVLDASFDGRGRDGLELVPGTRFEAPATEPVTDDDRVVVWTASVGDGPVDTWADAGHGTFTWTALGGLRGWADGILDGQPDGHLTLAEANAYTEWTGRMLGTPLHPGLLGDPSHGDLVVGAGSWLEDGPTDEQLAAWSKQRRDRRFEDMESLMRAEAAAFWQATLASAQQGGAEGRAALEAFIDEFGDKEITLTWAVALPEVLEARQLLNRYDEAVAAAGPTPAPLPSGDGTPARTGDGGTASDAGSSASGDAVADTDVIDAAELEARRAAALAAQEEARRAAEQAALAQLQAAAQAAEEASCDDLVAIEPDAMLGKLSPGQIACLDLRVRTDRLQTDKEKASKVLIINAQSRGDREEWARLVKRHLTEISRADPTLAMHYAVYLYQTDPVEYGEDAIHWADVALENKQVWEGDAHVDNVAALMGLRTQAAYKLWIAADREYRAHPDEDLEWQSEEYRGWTKDFAREWLDFLRAAGRPADLALQICTSAAGTADFCRAR